MSAQFATGVVQLLAATATPVEANSNGTTVILLPLNPAAGALIATHGYYTQTTDTGFTILTADGSHATGNEEFGWIIL